MNVLDNCDQVVIYGANGWMGRSAIDYISTVLPGSATETLLLIGSKLSHLEINGKSYQIKELTGMSEKEDSILINTPLPKNYLGMRVGRIMLVDIGTGDFVSFPNKNYKLDIDNKCYVIPIEDKKEIKTGNFNKI